MNSSGSLLKEELEKNHENMLPLLKALANKSRIRIMTHLLDDPKSFNFLLQEIGLQKTALSNHIKLLFNAKLIDKPDHGRYRITTDGRELLRAFNNAWNNSYLHHIKKIEETQTRGMSESFLNSFLKRN